MRASEIRSLSEIAAGSLVKPSVTARDVHSAVAGRAFGMLGPLATPTRLIHDRVSDVAYRAVAVALRTPVRAGGRVIAERAGANDAALADSTPGSLALGVLNGIAGDRLVRDRSDLAPELAVRRSGREVSLDAEGLAAAFQDAAPRLAVFVHGLCETEAAWRLGALGAHPPRTYGERLRAELDYTPVYVRYNTGLHVSDNGRRLAAALDALATQWPVRVEEIALVGHSMGGLVCRSACYYGEQQGHGWTDRLRHVFCLATPHLGAPLERAANVAGWALSRAPEARPFADLFLNGRSAGIKDLRFGNCIEEDWHGCDPDEFLRDRCCEVPFLPSATYYFIGATLTRRPGGLGGLIGDLLVHYPSASGAGRSRRIPFELENGRHLGGAHHLQLLNHPDVYAQIRDWLERDIPGESQQQRIASPAPRQN
jgi:pimeloyl-ACP methyl ester carboxylesterase